VTRALLVGTPLAAAAILLAVYLPECEAWGEEADAPTAAVIQTLSPRVSDERADRLAVWFDESADRYLLDVRLLVALAYRESGFRAKAIGPTGAIGIMQTKPGGAALRWAPRGCRDQYRPRCSIATGAGYLAALRDEICPGSWWRWIASYRYSRCLSEAEARRDRGARRARELYRRAGGRAW